MFRAPTSSPAVRVAISTAVSALALLAAGGCAKKHPSAPAPGASRTFRMGFSGIPARPDQAQAIAAIQMWTARADGAIWHEEPPWSEILAGLPADSLVRSHYESLAQYYRARGLTLTFEIDPTNGLDRSAESDSLRVHGLSIAMPAVQAAFLRFATAVDTILAPEYLGLASETNLVRLAAPAPLYQAMKQLANATADSLAALHARRAGAHAGTLYASVQVDIAWGGAAGSGPYVGIATDLADFPFASVVGLSSYPYLDGFTDPGALPLDWFSRIADEAGKPVMVVEGGWTSASLASAGVLSSPATQARYARRMSALLDAGRAIGWYQLTFTDLDLASFPPQPPGSILPLFAALGWVDADLHPKPALAVWDSVYARPRGF